MIVCASDALRNPTISQQQYSAERIEGTAPGARCRCRTD